MKKYIITGFMFLAALSFASCSQDKLDIPQKGVVSMDDFYKTDEDAESAAVAAYAASQYAINMGGGFSAGWCIAPPMFVLSNAPSDDIYYGSGNKDDHTFGLEINEFRPTFMSTSTVINSSYRGLYNAIYACNLVTDNFTYGTSDVIDRAISEARALRAWAHFWLATYWGTPPLIDHVLAGDAKPSNTDHDVLLKWCIKEFDEASKYLPSKSNLNDSDLAVRFTKEAALAFEGKVQLFAGDYAGAKASLKQVIDSKKYELVDGSQMHDLFHRAGDACKEKVFEFNFIDNPGNNPSGIYHFQYNASCFWRDLNSLPNNVIQDMGWGGINPTGKYAEALIANDGIDSYRRKAWIVTYDEMINDMPYDKPELFKEDGTPLRGVSAVGVFGHEGYWAYKMTPMRSDLQQNNTAATDQNQVVMRYAEVLLMYAEACAQTGDASGLSALNEVQNRAGSKHVSSSLTMTEVQNEKRYEMWLEGCRFPDLVRWGLAATELADNGKSVPTFKDHVWDAGAPQKFDGYVVWDSYNKEGQYGFKAGKNEVMPFPYSEIKINPNLKQNDNWE